MRELTRDERFKLLSASVDASMRGDEEEAIRIMRENFPMDPSVALAVKESRGKDYLLGMGWDLSKAEARYGTGWLDRPDSILR